MFRENLRKMIEVVGFWGIGYDATLELPFSPFSCDSYNPICRCPKAGVVVVVELLLQ